MPAHLSSSDIAANAASVPEPRAESVHESGLGLQLQYTGEGSAVLRISGDIDLANTERLREMVQCRLRSELRALELDLSRIHFMSVSGAQLLARAAAWAQANGTELRITVGESRAVRRVLRATGIDGYLSLRG